MNANHSENQFGVPGLRVFERGWLSSNNVLFDGGNDGQSLLVDTGYASHSAQTVELVRRALGERSLNKIVNTHLHSDHCGGNAALQAAFACEITVPAGEAGKIDAWSEATLTFDATGQNCPRFRRTGSIAAGDTLQCGPFQWEAIAAPGHDPESLVLYQPESGLLISADALWENGFGVVFPELEGENGFDDVRATLDRLSQLSVRWVIPGHGSPFQDFHGALDRAYCRLDGFVADPLKHARHAAKVLIKFRILEIQQQPIDEFHRWLACMRYMRLTHDRYFASIPFRAWCDGLLQDLIASRVITVAGESFVNI